MTGRRLRFAESARYVQPHQIAALRQRLLDREPVARAARSEGIGAKTAYRIRDELAAELEATGQALPPPILPGKSKDAFQAIRISRWMPDGKLQRYRTLLVDHDAKEARTIVLAEAAAERHAKAAKPMSFEEQLARVAAGARLIEKPRYATPDPERTLGGVASGLLT